jgi:PilZ domain-containing protein
MRAQRFPLHAPVRYRADDGGWLIGTTENISRTGLLLHVDETLELNTPIEMIVELPTVTVERNGEGEGTETAVHLVCHGHIVRTAASPNGNPGAMMAATIARYRFAREE